MLINTVCVQRLQGKKVRFVTGTDEHGEKIAEAAKARGMQPQEHCDSVVEEYKSLWTQVASGFVHTLQIASFSLTCHPNVAVIML